MSKNQNKTFLVRTTAVVKANNMREAELAISRVRVPNTTVITRDTSVEQIKAAQVTKFLEA